MHSYRNAFSITTFLNYALELKKGDPFSQLVLFVSIILQNDFVFGKYYRVLHYMYVKIFNLFATWLKY